ncbi:MAG: hypothetical protein JW783_11410 [Bacteroidales bacterium]|nr:hypothetical protein [Bacteroidales bacterium]MBN2750500.1 hypothetical protein [Bacteroidales bacterium]
MKRIIAVFTIALAMLPATLCAQGTVPSQQQIANFAKTTTLVVLDGRDMAFDAMLSEAVKKNWTLTPFELISSERFEQEKTNTNYSFLLLTQTTFDKDKIETTYNFFNLVLAHPTGDISEMPVLAHMPFSGARLTSSNNIYKTGAVLKAIQCQARKATIAPDKYTGKLSTANNYIKELKGKTLIVSASQLQEGIGTEEAFGKLYKNTFKIVSNEELEQAVLNPESKTVFLHLVAPEEEAAQGRCYKMLIDAYSGEVHYSKMHRISATKPCNLLKSDLRKIRWAPFHWL